MIIFTFIILIYVLLFNIYYETITSYFIEWRKYDSCIARVGHNNNKNRKVNNINIIEIKAGEIREVSELEMEILEVGREIFWKVLIPEM